MSTPVAHTISNAEVGITECGLLVTEAPVRSDDGTWESGPFKVAMGGVAIWDDQETPAGHVMCGPCHTAYNA